ncbi:hypothetical protein DSY14_24195 [Nocardiopsis sp. MG754419]|nr:hypothetical protein [Nocardiopsis sp. MG754419]
MTGPICPVRGFDTTATQLGWTVQSGTARTLGVLQADHPTHAPEHTNVGFSSLAFPPIPTSFYSCDLSAVGDRSTVNP